MNIFMRIWCFAALSFPVSFSVTDAMVADPDPIFYAMNEELSRSMDQMKIDVFDPPYYINYQLRHHEYMEVAGSFGALTHSDHQNFRTLFVDVRVGSQEFDSFTPGSHQLKSHQIIPLDDDPEVLRRALWYETDLRYKQAIMNFLRKKGRFISGVEKHNLADFSSGNVPIEHIDPVVLLSEKISEWESQVRKVSAIFKSAPDIEKSQVKFRADRFTRYFYDSEKNKIRTSRIHYQVILEVWAKSESGDSIHDQEPFYFSNINNFPSSDELVEKAEMLIEEVGRLQSATRMDPYVGPAIFSPEAAAVLFHEAIGHRLEGDRLRQANDGKTFMKKIGAQILPGFLSVVDNPNLDSFAGHDLLGYYKYDDEGQKAEEVVLVDQGRLKNFLMSRTPVLGFFRTNGHARSDGQKRPMSRMSNVIVRSEKRLSPQQLKTKLIEEIQKQNKPFGLLIEKISGGETHTGTDAYQVFKGKPLYLRKIYPDGREELVSGVDFVGTPLSMVSKVVATGDDEMVINGYCGAESGLIPVTSITPSILLTEVELQGAHEKNLRRPILPPPEL